MVIEYVELFFPRLGWLKVEERRNVPGSGGHAGALKVGFDAHDPGGSRELIIIAELAAAEHAAEIALQTSNRSIAPPRYRCVVKAGLARDDLEAARAILSAEGITDVDPDIRAGPRRRRGPRGRGGERFGRLGQSRKRHCACGC